MVQLGRYIPLIQPCELTSRVRTIGNDHGVGIDGNLLEDKGTMTKICNWSLQYELSNGLMAYCKEQQIIPLYYNCTRVHGCKPMITGKMHMRTNSMSWTMQTPYPKGVDRGTNDFLPMLVTCYHWAWVNVNTFGVGVPTNKNGVQ